MSQNREAPGLNSELVNEEIIESLSAAYSPSLLDLELNNRLIEAALSQSTTASLAAMSEQSLLVTPETQNPSGLESISAVEREQATRLAEALDGEGIHPLAELAKDVRAAHAPASITVARAEDLVHQAIRNGRRPKVVSIGSYTYATAVLALAAGVTLWMNRSLRPESYTALANAEQLVQSRSVAPLFAETFGQATTTQRIDRIYAVRSRELRHNRYATWRVR
jgi:hypothetical protein